MNASDFIVYLGDTLIPDLEASGSTATAEDFAKCLELIDELAAHGAELAGVDKSEVVYNMDVSDYPLNHPTHKDYRAIVEDYYDLD